MSLDWDQSPDPPADSSLETSLPPVRSIRVLGEALEPAARRAAELAACEERLRDHPDDVEALLERGWLRLKMSKAAEAIPDLERGLRLRPDDTDALYLLATAQVQTNDRAAARATLEKYLADAGDDSDARALKGQMALQLGRLEEADDDFSKVLKHEPHRGRVRFDRARIRLRVGRLAEALADFDALVARFPRDPQPYEWRSQVYDRLGRRDQALADLKRAAELPGVPGQAYNNLAWRLATGPAALRDPREAVALARKAVASSPERAIFLNTLGVAEYRAGLFADATTTLENSLAASKGESDAFDLFFLAMARYRLGRIVDARTDFDRAMKWRHEHPNPGQPGWSEELDAFEAEARDLLYGPPPDLPADVFAPGPIRP
jgi:tetratricopeptide (TPR) repeat protein